jgi:oligopeptide/dipeptide ABC transporter ATP-binding protein
MSALLRVEHLTVVFPASGGAGLWAVNDVSFELARGETLALVGESGSGKTTVGRSVLRLLRPTAGRVLFDGIDITALEEARMRALRHRMSLVFQDPYTALNPARSVQQTVGEPLAIAGILDRDERMSRVRSTIDAVGLTERHLRLFPGDLTASEQQRLGIARAIATRPDLVVVDEATSNLDTSGRASILGLFIELQKRYGIAYLFISHDMTAVERVAHRIAIMYLGRLVEAGRGTDVFGRQLHPYSRALLSAVLYPDPSRKLEPFTLSGEIPSPIDPPNECPLVGRCPFVQSVCYDPFPGLVEVEPGRFSACLRWSELDASGDLRSDPDAAGR